MAKFRPRVGSLIIRMKDGLGMSESLRGIVHEVSHDHFRVFWDSGRNNRFYYQDWDCYFETFDWKIEVY